MRRNSKIALLSVFLFLLIIYGVSVLTTNGVVHKEKEAIEIAPPAIIQNEPNVRALYQGHEDEIVQNDIAEVAQKLKEKHQQKFNLNADNTKNYQIYSQHSRVSHNTNSNGNSRLNPYQSLLHPLDTLAGASPTKLKIPYKVVHLDLKGAPPKVSYLTNLFPLIRQAGGNSLLIEWEDMFPYTGILNETTHKKHFTEDEIKSILKAADENELEVIPLVQTFGHLEFILKLEKFAELREVDNFPQEVCPSNDKAWLIIREMIDQTMRLHPKINYIHIGADEVYHLAECEKCRKKDPKVLFLDHVMRVANYVQQKYKVNLIIWDDMLRKYYTEELKKSGIGDSGVEIMIWDYTPNVDHLVSPYLWPMYSSVFKNIWVASAFKGAFGEQLYQVDVQRHVLNQLSWIKTLTRESNRIANLRGVAITGWSRYDHFAILCELLPGAVPSLILSLLILKYQSLSQTASHEFEKLFKCDVVQEFIRLDECIWEGKDFYLALGTLKFYENYMKDIDKIKKGWLTDYNVNHNYTSPWRLDEPMIEISQTLSSLRSFEGNVRLIMRKYFEDYVIDEWIEEKIYPIKLSLTKIISDIKTLKSRKFWGRRPLDKISSSSTIKTNLNSNKNNEHVNDIYNQI